MIPGAAAVMKRSGNLAAGDLSNMHSAEVVVAERASRLRRVEELGSSRHSAPPYDFDVLGKFAHVPRRRAFTFAAKTLHPLRHIGLKTDPRLLAVVADVDARSELALDHVRDGGFGFAIEQLFINRLAALLLEQQFSQFRIARQASDMGRENALFAFQHGEGPLRGTRQRARDWAREADARRG